MANQLILNCPNCAWENDTNHNKCTHCGCNLTNISPLTKASNYSESLTRSGDILEPVFCSSCGGKIAKEASFCPKCGGPNKASPAAYSFDGIGSDGIPVKSRVAAGILALFIGGIGVHKFYCGQIGLGVIYLIFCWTFIPSIIAFIEVIIYLTSPNDEVFTKRYCQ